MGITARCVLCVGHRMPIPCDDRKIAILSWIFTLIPRVGVVRPF
jgi:hypothetical protein